MSLTVAFVCIVFRVFMAVAATILQPASGLSGLPGYTCPPRGPLAQLGERRLCTAEPGPELPVKTTRRSDAGIDGLQPRLQPPMWSSEPSVASVARVASPQPNHPGSS